eukprot:TRINITY_DN2494_c0_g1_i1.p2 TRINITY_DN2494_c0_g1~~TRINITY_DN2494_c0_g1_i1.p2  ORF type:complete len:184 (+),score=36.64 TRINITY_DN2494_c0_g1_i1:102-653(+)
MFSAAASAMLLLAAASARDASQLDLTSDTPIETPEDSPDSGAGPVVVLLGLSMEYRTFLSNQTVFANACSDILRAPVTVTKACAGSLPPATNPECVTLDAQSSSRSALTLQGTATVAEISVKTTVSADTVWTDLYSSRNDPALAGFGMTSQRPAANAPDPSSAGALASGVLAAVVAAVASAGL